jgi:hypothetical protein
MNAHSNPRAATERRVLTDRQASVEELDRAIVKLAARINADTHDFLVLIRRFDERAGWLKSGCESCADWLHYRCDISKGAAREKVRVAHAIKTLPAIAVAFANGRLSYSKVRALTRVANRDNEGELLAFALRTTAARVEERCREMRCGAEESIDDAVRAHARRELRLRRDDARGTVVITVELPLETGELVDKALEKALEVSAASGPEFKEDSWAAQRADALVALAKDYLSGGRNASGEEADAGATSGTPDHYQVTVHVDEAALRGNAGSRSGLPIETVRRLACDSDLIVLVEDEHANPLSVGRKTRVVPKAIKRALWARDKGCAFPGCGRKRYVEAHHCIHWSAGGETSLQNCLLLCSAHHKLLHEGGFTMEKDYRDRWFFRRPDGRAVPACGYRPEDVTDDDIGTAGEYFGLCASSSVSRVPAETSRASEDVVMVNEPSAAAWMVSDATEVYCPTRRFAEVRVSAGTPLT